MKKLIGLLLISIITVQAMEESYFEISPPEIKLQIIDYLSNKNVLKEFLKDILSVCMANKNCWLQLNHSSISIFILKKLDQEFNENIFTKYALLTNSIDWIRKYGLFIGDNDSLKIRILNAILLDVVKDKGHAHVIKLLMEDGANPNVEDEIGLTPLIYSIFNNDNNSVLLLLENGADVNYVAPTGLKALGVSAYLINSFSNQKQITQYLLAFGAHEKDVCRNLESALMISIVTNNKKIAEYLLEKGISTNFHNFDGNTPLIYAAKLVNEEFVRLLLENGADVNEQNYYGETALSISLDSNYPDISNLFINHEMSEQFLK